jgi:hypothetical protein
MPYTAQISADSPSCFLFMIDQSTSMDETFSAGAAAVPKAVGVADTMNRWLQELSIKCAKSKGVRDYYHVGVIGYGKRVAPCLSGSSLGQELLPISNIAENPARIEEKAKGVRSPVWFEPAADGGTPMCRAITDATRVIESWLEKHPNCFPPIVIHITDGEATDGDPASRLQQLTSLSSKDGNVMLFNIHLSANPNAKPVTFPDSSKELPDDFSKMLFETASPLTPNMRALAREYRIKTSDKSRGFVLNADIVLLVQAIDIGTRPSNLR